MSVPPHELGSEDDKLSLLSDGDVDLPTPDEEPKPRSYPVHDGQDRPNAASHHYSRAKSPDTLSCISVDDISVLRHPLSGQGHIPKTWRETLKCSWTRNKGLALVLISQVFGTLMNVTTRLLELEGHRGKGMDPFQILFVRMGITVLLSSLYMWYKKIEDFPFGAKDVRLLLVARGIGGFFGVFGMYYSLLYLPLADATVITFLAPNLACWACSFLINEPFTRMEQIAAFISLFGVVLIARPTSFFSSSSPTPPASGNGDVAPTTNSTTHAANAGSYHKVTPAHRAGAVGIALLGVVGSAVAYTTIRWIGKRAHPLISVNYFASWAFVVATVVLAGLPGASFALPADAKEWALLLFLGVCGFVMQFLMAAGLQYEKSSRATNMVYTQMLFALAFDKLFFGTTPGLLSILGSSLILGSAIYVAVRKDKAQETATNRSRDEERALLNGTDSAEEDAGPSSRAGANAPERMPLQEVQLRALRV